MIRLPVLVPVLLRRAALCAAPLALAGCITPYPDLSQSRSPCREGPGGWCDFTRAIAAQTYGYAMLSSNAYDDEDTYTRLGPRFEPVGIIPPEADEERAGLAYALFDEYATQVGPDGAIMRGARKGRVMAFRGTEFSGPTDIFRGSLQNDQIEQARRLFLKEQARFAADYPGLPMVTTGHSLGGALATQVSIENPGIRAYVFNVSPFYTGESSVGDADRIAVAERGEFLRAFRRFRAPPAATSLVINCRPDAGAGAKHGVRALADCLSWIAAYDDPAAYALIAPNTIGKPPIECGEADRPHPGVGYRPTEPCPHLPAGSPGE